MAAANSVSNYDESFPSDKLQRYFEFYTDSDGKLRGRCRKCETTCSRASYSTTKMREHLKKCDENSFKLLDLHKKDKTSLASSSSRSSVQQSNIMDAFKVNLIILLILSI